MSENEDDGSAVAMIGLLLVGCVVVCGWLLWLFVRDG
jgi:hypothetical protein